MNVSPVELKAGEAAGNALTADIEREIRAMVEQGLDRRRAMEIMVQVLLGLGGAIAAGLSLKGRADFVDDAGHHFERALAVAGVVAAVLAYRRH